MLNFCKMHGIGNDYVLLDCVSGRVPQGFSPNLVKELCDRRRGVGADGVLLVLPSKKAAFRMRIFNADGSEAEMCGNGIRCVGKYIFDHKLTGKKNFSVETLAGIKKLYVRTAAGRVKTVRVDMGIPCFEAEKIPVRCGSTCAVNFPVKIGKASFRFTAVSMGNPHCVIFVPGARSAPVERAGPELERHQMFPNRTNVEFAEVISRKEMNLRVWERGVGETRACGTGACAAVATAVLTGRTGRVVRVNLPGGALNVSWPKGGSIFMEGPAEEVYRGKLTLQIC